MIFKMAVVFLVFILLGITNVNYAQQRLKSRNVIQDRYDAKRQLLATPLYKPERGQNVNLNYKDKTGYTDWSESVYGNTGPPSSRPGISQISPDDIRFSRDRTPVYDNSHSSQSGYYNLRGIPPRHENSHTTYTADASNPHRSPPYNGVTSGYGEINIANGYGRTNNVLVQKGNERDLIYVSTQDRSHNKNFIQVTIPDKGNTVVNIGCGVGVTNNVLITAGSTKKLENVPARSNGGRGGTASSRTTVTTTRKYDDDYSYQGF